MEGFPPSSMDDLTEFDLESLFLSYVILKHILSEDDCLQFSYFSLSYYSMEAGRHRRFQSTKAPYYAMIKVDIRMWSTIVFNKQLSFQLHFQKPWWVLMLTPICYNVHWIRHHYSFIHQPQTGHGYMTPNATTSQHGEFNQPGPSSPAPWYPIFHV